MARGREEEKEEIDDEDDERGQTDEIRKWGISRYVSLDMFLSSVKLSRGFMCLFISPLPSHTPCSYTSARYTNTHIYTHIRDPWRREPVGGSRRSQCRSLL